MFCFVIRNVADIPIKSVQNKYSFWTCGYFTFKSVGTCNIIIEINEDLSLLKKHVKVKNSSFHALLIDIAIVLISNIYFF